MTKEEARAILEEVETIDDSMYQYNPAYLKALNMAIAALKAEPCEDCDKWETDKTACQKCGEPCGDAVKRESVLNTLDTMNKALDENRTVEAYKELLQECYKALPRVTPKQKWIPVSERIPEESLNCVLGWDDNRERCVFVQYVNGRFQFVGRDSGFKITAWMPLPAPYKEGESE